MTYPELQIQLDLNPDNRINILKSADVCERIDIGYLFVDSEDGQCYLFDEDGNLDDISKVKRIEYSAFKKCTSLTSITIPNSIEWIGYRAFYNCTSLKEVVFEGKTIDQVKAMDWYPWGIKDESVIRCLG